MAPATAISPTVWLTTQEAAAYAKVTPITLMRAVKAGRLKAYKTNGVGHVRYRAADLDAWLTASAIAVTR